MDKFTVLMNPVFTHMFCCSVRLCSETETDQYVEQKLQLAPAGHVIQINCHVFVCLFLIKVKFP